MSQSADQCPSCKVPRSVPTLISTLTPVPGSDEETVYAPVPSHQAFDSDRTYYAPPSSGAGEGDETTGIGQLTGSCDTTGLPLGVDLDRTVGVEGEEMTALGDPKAASTRGGVRQTAAMRAAEGPLQVGQQFSPRYIIVRLLGIGGMGAVYQAWDAELAVMVAVKVVRPEVTRDPAAAREIERRFKQELLLARQVTHRNVVRIHDMGEIDGIKYITMPFIEGDDLATVLRKSGRLEMANIMAIARQVATGLKAAHDAGVVHRDLKPANIMIGGDSEAIIMDFGIAHTASNQQAAAIASARQAGTVLPKSLESELTRVAATMHVGTMVGAIVGTVAYMAPEQARGEEVDQRTDIYAFGLILYDLLLGKRRVEDGGAVADLQKRLEHPLPSPRAAAPDVPGMPDVPEPLSRFVAQCIEPDAAKRFATTGDMVAALDRLDDRGKLRPSKRAVGLPLLAATVVVLLGLTAGALYYQRQFIPPPQHDPVSVLIADFANSTGDAAFDQTLEPVLRRALEDTGFVSAYDRGAMRTLGVRPPAIINETAAREIAVKQGLGVVLSGAIERAGGGYQLSVKAIQAVTGNVIASERGRAGDRNQVLPTATRLIAGVRSALGDDASESDQLFKAASMSATSLDVIRLYAAGRQAASNNRYEEAREQYRKAVALDPKFGIGYQALAAVSLNLGASKDAERYAQEALSHLDGMTQREVYSIRGLYYLTTGDYQQCVKEYGDLISAYPADVAGHNNLALCATYLRDLPKAIDEMQRVVAMLPKRDLYRVNLALYSNYAGEFQAAEREARAIQAPDVKALTALAFAQLGQEQQPAALETYQRLAKLGPLGASVSASGIGDMAAYEGRFGDAVRVLRAGAIDDVENMRTEAAASKLVGAAIAELGRGRSRAAIDAADDALAQSRSVKTRFLAARVFIEAGAAAKARPLMTSLAGELQIEPQAYAKILEGDVALAAGDARQAVRALTEANTILSTWFGHYDLGRAYLALNAFPQADSEFGRCLKRRGEAMSLFLDDEPTYGMFPAAYYYQGRARQGLKLQGAADAFRQYLKLRGASKDDVLVADARRQLGG